MSSPGAAPTVHRNPGVARPRAGPARGGRRGGGRGPAQRAAPGGSGGGRRTRGVAGGAAPTEEVVWVTGWVSTSARRSRRRPSTMARAGDGGLGNRALQVPSVVFVTDDGEVLVGEAAERRGASTRPGGARVQAPDRRPGAAARGGHAFSPQALMARLLPGSSPSPPSARAGRRTRSPSPTRRTGDRSSATCSARRSSWPASRDADQSPSPRPRRSPTRRATGWPRARRLAVYDLGGGTFDAAVLRRDAPTASSCSGPPRASSTSAASTSTRRCSTTSSTALGDQVADARRDDPATTVGAGPAAARLRRGQGGAVGRHRDRRSRWRCPASAPRSG